jgi:phosphoglycerate kinase
MAFRRLRDLPVQDGTRVLIRVDFNVPLAEDNGGQRVTSDARIRAALPTIQNVLERGGRPVLMSHLGRPKGKVVESMRMKPAADRLAELLGTEVRTASECIGSEVEAMSRDLPAGACLVVENLRFHPEEEKGDDAFAAELAKLGDVYVNDAFGTSHRAHASVAGVPKLLPAAAGLLLEAELDAFAKVLEAPERPVCAILGGAKVSDKLPVILHLLDKVDRLLIGGAMAYTFLRARGVGIGKSLSEEDLLDEARRVEEIAKQKNVELHIPSDHVCATAFAADAEVSVHGPGVPDGLMGLDIGPESAARYADVVRSSKTVIWNGPMGVFEMAPFAKGTEAVARALAASSAFSVVGGGDSVAAIETFGLENEVDHVSTGGGASLELLEGKVLPGVAALEQA